MNGRVQDAVTGTFLSADLYIGRPMNTQNYNLYGYVYNNPLTLNDPTGYCPPGTGQQVTKAGYELEEVVITAERPSWLSRVAHAFGNMFKRKPSRPQGQKCGAPSLAPHGVGLSAGGNAEAGVGAAGAAGQISTGGGYFHNSNGGWSSGTYISYGAAANAGSATAGTPTQSSTPFVAGASLGGGASLFVTNAQSVHQLEGSFTTYSLNVGIGPLQASVQLSVGGDIWQFGISPPVAGETLGFSVSSVTTNTEVDPNNDGCQ